MKRNLLILLTLLLGLIYFACRKNETVTLPKFEDPFVASAADYLKSQISNQDFQSLDFKSVRLLKTNSVTTGIIIHMNDKNDKRSIILAKQNLQTNPVLSKNTQRSISSGENGNKFKGNWLTVEYKGSKNDGIIHTKSFDGSKSTDAFFVNRKVVKLIETKNGVIKTTIIKWRKKKQLAGTSISLREMDDGAETTEIDGEEYEWLPDVTVSVDLDNNSTDFYSIFWEIDSEPDYLYSYTTVSPSEYNDGQGEEIGSSNTYNIGYLYRGPNVIGNINDYLKCFTNLAGSNYTYKVTVCVDQPVSGSRTPWGFSSSGGNPINVGHTFLILTETTPTGTTTRNVGFYPENSATPFSPNDQGQLNNNEDHGYDISLSVTMTNSQFFSILNFVSQGNNAGYYYNLNSNNCTTFSINALSSAGIHIPATQANWLNGGGYDPGDLGEDIRAMALPSNMTRNTTSTSHPNLGNCEY